MTTRAPWIERIVGSFSPGWALNRSRARIATEVLQRHYEGAAVGRRTQGWHRSTSDANRSIGPYAGRLRDVARDLVRNNPYAESALRTIVDHTVGWGLVAKPSKRASKAEQVWKAWAETSACDADGRHNFYGLQKLVMRTVAESGEVLIRRRFRRPEDGLPIPMQLQVLEPDFLDTTKDLTTTPNGGRIIQGIEFDAIGQRVAYWLFPEHPGSGLPSSLASRRIPAENLLHVFLADRPGQVRGVSWFAPVLLRFKDFDELEDATLMKQKVAACLAVITTDVDGTAAPLGTVDSAAPDIDMLSPAAILNLPSGRSVEVVQPPSVREYGDYSTTILKGIAAGLHVTYEDMAGDYADLPFSAARMSRLQHWGHVEDWRWHLLVPQFCDPVWAWAMEVAAIFGAAAAPAPTWTAQPAPMIDPVNEGLAYKRNIRAGIQTLSDALRERGYDPRTVLDEMAADNKLIDELGLMLDSDPRRMTEAGQAQSIPAATPPATPTGVAAG